MSTLSQQDVATPPQSDSTRLIPLTQGRQAVVSLVDYEYLSQFKWCALIVKSTGQCYATRSSRESGVNRTIYMHREIMNFPSGMYVDHIDGIGTNNTRPNLRVATSSQSACNRLSGRSTSGVKGVSWCKQTSKWQAKIAINGHHVWIGRYKTKQEAAQAYAIAANNIHGEFKKIS